MSKVQEPPHIQSKPCAACSTIRHWAPALGDLENAFLTNETSLDTICPAFGTVLIKSPLFRHFLSSVSSKLTHSRRTQQEDVEGCRHSDPHSDKVQVLMGVVGCWARPAILA